VNTAVSSAIQREYDDIIFAAFAFDAASQDRIHETNLNPADKLKAHMAQIRPDVLLGDLLKGNKAGGKAAETAKASQQLFTVFGQPRTRIEHKGSEYTAHMDGVDVYDPVKNSIEATKAGKVAAWFLDTDYDGRTFCICQAFFPDKSAWEKLAKALSGTIDPAAFEAFSGTKSLTLLTNPLLFLRKQNEHG
jgi:adenine-specific DNA-methyltransferase